MAIGEEHPLRRTPRGEAARQRNRQRLSNVERLTAAAGPPRARNEKDAPSMPVPTSPPPRCGCPQGIYTRFGAVATCGGCGLPI